MVILTVNGIDCYYGSVKVLENVRFSVKERDFTGILGPNGSGKTTLLRSISRTLKPHKGVIFLNEVNIYTLKSVDVAKQMAVVPQDNVIAFNFTALDIVLMGRNPHLSRFQMESEKDIAIARGAMELTNTWHLKERPINELSGGERQRVIIARALAQEPKILLLDEPTVHLDINNQLEIMDLLKELCTKKGLIVLAVFHDFNLAARYCDSAILLKGGKIVSAGNLDAVLTSENIRSVFQVDAMVKRHSITDCLYVMPVSMPKPLSSRNLSVHLICGAGTGTTLMKILVNEGYNVTAGVLNVLDTDYETARLLKIPVTSEAPFSPITEETHRANLEMISKASAVVLTAVPFGYGNLRNLEAAKEALKRGNPTFVIEEVPIEQRDFTKGKAKKHLTELKSKGATFVRNQDELLSLLDISDDKLKIAKEPSTKIPGHLKPETNSHKGDEMDDVESI
ncbi:MAG: ABC transporter ATP-binding protein [Candidatus Bathyarchaeota archaeon]|nr:ABC transporter ATP-binding protein [Candidatus Bathyarchaeota archaeon]MDH5532080.1 ABC transporter ATP-binding protein [Candidatus Bathyarchaeota archaeon]MDH5712679.1 ABC transporter ATP-binding protein [Candidatus Bathyarchaeota archaeon]